MKITYQVAAFAAAMTISAVALPHVAVAQTTLTVDVGTLYAESVAAKSGNAQLEAKYGDRIKTIQTNYQTAGKAWNDQVEAARKLLKPDGTGTLPPATETSLAQARKNLTDAQQQVDEIRQEIDYVRQYVQSQIFEKMAPIAEKIRKERKAEIVMPRNVVLAFDPSTDITASVLQQLNATMTTVSITLPQQQAPAPAGTAQPATPPKQQPQTR